jgi:hypothetical protein
MHRPIAYALSLQQTQVYLQPISAEVFALRRRTGAFVKMETNLHL